MIASRAMRPVRRLTDAVSSVSISRLDERVQAGKEGVEFSELIRVYNDMLDRLERSFNQATRFSADAAHELKTPLTILQGHLETALQEAPDNSEQQRALRFALGGNPAPPGDHSPIAAISQSRRGTDHDHWRAI